MGNNLKEGGLLIAIFVGVIIATVLVTQIANDITAQRNTYTIVNETVTTPAVNTTLSLTGRELVGDILITNMTDEFSDQFDTSDRVVDGLRTVAITSNDTTNLTESSSSASLNVSYTYRPDGYLPTATDRSIGGLIPLFAVIGILIFTIVMLIKSGSLGRLMRR